MTHSFSRVRVERPSTRARALSAGLFGFAFGLFLAAIVLFAVHGLFHLWEWLWWPPPDALRALYGASEVGRYIHAATEAIIALALVLGLWRAIGRSG